MSRTGTILLVEDDPGAAESLQRVLEDEGHTVIAAQTGEKGLALAGKERCDAVLTDLRLPGLSGLDLVKQLHTARPRLPIILMTAHGTTEVAIDATRHGAFDYLLKPFEMPALLDAIQKALAASRLMSQPVEMGSIVAGRDAIIGNSRAMQEIYKEIGRVAATSVTVLIRGETGTGKELVARAIYQHSDRAQKPFIAVNCAAIPETLLESELFGHEKGAFTGADARRIGRFEQADGGTLFLDEIGDLAMNTQVKLLRVLQEKSLQRIGGKETIPIDVRVIAATHRDLDAAMREKHFREDLFFRLNVVSIGIPSLRQRPEDIPDLVRYFLARYGAELGIKEPSIQAEALQFFSEQSWPGNVRELENAVRKALLLARGYPIGLDEGRNACSGSPATAASGQSLAGCVAELLAAASRGEIESAHAALIDAAERELFAQAIELAQGNQAKAARWLGISRLTMREKLTRLGLHPTRGEPET
ncbi:MAG: two-component system, NtrC family, nitrogen regulation response regulator GlnG [Chthoniobacter sp.]|jgi:nitrogen regulation protein NR(I)|nr:two-component system, NtrC family, nitrogen regulation response regulator GlnG [Chthoniobacter sp.]